MLIAHISDPHVARSPEPGEYTVKRALAYINYRLFRRRRYKEHIARESLEKLASRRPDLVLLTGDLTQHGLDAEFDAAEELLSVLTRKNIPVIAVSGNHDMYGPARRGRLDALTRDLALGMEPGEDGIVRLAGVELLPLFQGVSTRLPFFSHGRQNRDELARAKASWTGPPVKVMRLVCGHYPVIGFHRGRLPYWRGLRGAAGLMEFCGRCGAAAYFCGHVHNRFTATMPGGCVQYVAPALSAVRASGGERASVYECGPELRRPHEMRGREPVEEPFDNRL